jgi:uncharacterized protein with HEPN domain
MLSETETGHLRDMLHYVEAAAEFTADFSYKKLEEDERTLLAVIRCLEIISEASRRLSDSLKLRHPNIPWRDMAAAGNFYRHDYGGITSLRVWKTLREDLPPLRTVIEQELARG